MAGEGGGETRPGMTPMEALRAATIAAADKLGFAPDLGSVEAGKMADLIVLDADPLADIHNSERIRWVVRNGVVYEAETMKELWPQEKDLPPFFWRN
jgi:imidazolonepropionase-like amidohydrolase